MPYQAQVLKVMIASPSDVKEEREIVRDVINEWNHAHSESRKQVLMAVGWETHSTPLMGDRPQSIINKQVLDGCDLLVAVFWTRIGSPTGAAVSGTAEEIQEHMNAGKIAMIYFSSAPVSPDKMDHKQWQALSEFKGQCYPNGLVETFDSIEQLRTKFTRQLSQTINKYFSTNESTTAPIPVSAAPNMADEARTLLIAAAKDPQGGLTRIRHFGGLVVNTNGRNFSNDPSARSIAKWENAISELEALGLIAANNQKRESFKVTHEGFKIVDLLESSSRGSPS